MKSLVYSGAATSIIRVLGSLKCILKPPVPRTSGQHITVLPSALVRARTPQDLLSISSQSRTSPAVMLSLLAHAHYERYVPRPKLSYWMMYMGFWWLASGDTRSMWLQLRHIPRKYELVPRIVHNVPDGFLLRFFRLGDH